MKRAIYVGLMAVMLLSVNQVRAEACEIVNGSFEDDGSIPDITVQKPNGWDVNVPTTKLQGYVDKDWPTDGSYNLTLRSILGAFTIGDTATVSQQVDLTDVNEIIFDLKLGTWNPDKCSAIVLIDEDVVWDSNELDSGNYYDQVYAVEDKYRDGQMHKLSLGIRVKVSGTLWLRYVSHWDYIECTDFCGGNGLLAGDFDHDCYVDMNDLKSMGDVWLDEPASYDRHNLYKGDDVDSVAIINFLDFAVFADNWLQSSYE